VKRLLDVAIALPLLAVFLPVLLLVALARRVRSTGSPVVTTARAGLNGQEFPMYVLRPDEPPCGARRFAERHGLASFPALVNVVRGEMSFVGPEPVARDDVERYDLTGRLRFDARPGVTGLSQVSLIRSSFSIDDATALDVHYVQNWSLAGDLRIVLRALVMAIAGTVRSDVSASASGNPRRG
jgi:lipopolysaccharide/colanic/teichoic acid biosynthesis glycosyltransferase